MTRRGSLAYYLAAWVCGCFFMAATIWLGNEIHPTVPRSVSLLLVTYFFSLMFGAVTSLLFGFFLRCAATGMHWVRAWHWLAGGAILAPALAAVLGVIASSPALQGSSWRVWIFLPLTGPYMINGSPGWMLLLTTPAGAATAWVLFRIYRAFTMLPLPPQAKP